MDFSIIIVNYNTEKLLKNCLNSIFDNCHNNNFEIIVVDNNSCDGSVEMLKNDFKNKINLIINDKNIGFGPANNLGAIEAKGDYLFFLNSDTIIKSDILIPLINFIKTDKKIGIISPKLLQENGQEQAYAYGKFPALFNTIIGKFRKPFINDVNPFEVDWVSGATLIIKKEIFKKIGGFDENFFMYFEDIDLCKQVKNLGYKIIVYGNISVTHLVAKSVCDHKKRKELYYQSQNYFYKKNFNALSLYFMKLIRLPYKLLKLGKHRI